MRLEALWTNEARVLDVATLIELGQVDCTGYHQSGASAALR